ncbi:TolC family protein [Bizionia saleffrena]|uniref:TolC family protein n=2 Tax=Bizionia saleffrena TaxID=291189 RepID=A0A8H2LJN5_9FLAO|nr:TolC family protein [Bizionia saleffrena]
MNFLKTISIVFVTLCGFGQQVVFSQNLQTRSMTIYELAESVAANNIQLKLANTAVDIADARIGVAKTNRLPDAGVDVKAMYLGDISIYDTRFKKLQTVDIPNFGNQFNVSASQLIFAGGKINKSIALAEMSKTLSENQFGDAEQSIKLNAIELYMNLYNLQNQKIILEQNRILANERTKNTRYFYEEDMITKNEVLRAEVLERQLEQSILQIENAILITNKNLTLFAGLDSKVLIVPEVEQLNHQIRNQDEASFLDLALGKNPQFNASETQITIAKKSLELTKTDRLPTLAGFAGYNANRPQTSGSPVLDLYTNTYQVGLSLSYNIESIYKNPKKEALDKILINQAEQRQEAVKQEIEANVNAAYKNYHQAVAQLKVSAINQTAADDNYRITELKYKNQLITYIEIIDAANTKLQAELQMLDDQTDIILNYVRLLRVTGQL